MLNNSNTLVTVIIIGPDMLCYILITLYLNNKAILNNNSRYNNNKRYVMLYNNNR